MSDAAERAKTSDVHEMLTNPQELDVFYTYTYGTAVWLAVQAVALILAPGAIINLLSSSVRDVTDLEIYLSRSSSLTLLALAALSLILTGSIPLTSRIPVASTLTPSNPADRDSQGKTPYVLPTLVIMTTYHAATAFYCYMQWTATGVTGFGLGILGAGGLASLGGWTIVFGIEDGRVSRKTGADKRTSGFLFPNKESAGAKKREWKKGQ